MEKILEDISFHAPDRAGESLEITGDFVRENVGELAKNTDLSRYIL